MSRAPQTAHAVRHRIYSVSVDAKPDVEGVASDNKGTSHKIDRDPAFRLTCASRWRKSQDQSMSPLLRSITSQCTEKAIASPLSTRTTMNMLVPGRSRINYAVRARRTDEGSRSSTGCFQCARVVYHVVYHNYGSDSPVYGSLEGHPDSDDDERGSTDSQVAAFG